MVTNQRNRHEALLRTLDGALGAFLVDMQRSDAGREFVVLVYSEFGRRVQENGARRTDHGVAAPMFVRGAQVDGGLYGKHPSLELLDDGDLVHTTDFRSVDAMILERRFGVQHSKVLRASYPLLSFIA